MKRAFAVSSDYDWWWRSLSKPVLPSLMQSRGTSSNVGSTWPPAPADTTHAHRVTPAGHLFKRNKHSCDYRNGRKFIEHRRQKRAFAMCEQT